MSAAVKPTRSDRSLKRLLTATIGVLAVVGLAIAPVALAANPSPPASSSAAPSHSATVASASPSAGGSSPSAGAASPSGAPASPGSPLSLGKPNTPIQHIVVLMQENHTFDNYFGTYPGADGIPTGVCMPIDPANPGAGCIQPHHLTSHRTIDLNHGSDVAALVENGGNWNNFVFAQNQRNLPGDARDGLLRRLGPAVLLEPRLAIRPRRPFLQLGRRRQP